ncbi:dihydrofolate reductase family protein [Leucobacter tardus]|uniref:Dihydrofolate reductase n=1 Tax=Leucobacter tardus TaxID=501483 RepID=A0A939QGH6_9MICO|nr:dihydrofolate reductase family protein [Leucobacter tardus]MBO2989708.1 dihydrofolate reductase [Leucobacter tardus]
MTQIVYRTATTLDGFIADPADSLAWLLRQQQSREGEARFDAFMAEVGAIVMGATTYEWVLAHDDGAWPYTQPAWVMTHRDLPARPGVHFVSGGVRELHPELAAVAESRQIWVVGGGDLAGQFADAGLLDEIVSSIAPVTLGSGRPLLPRRLDLELVEVLPNGSFIDARYRVIGPLVEDR